MGYKKKYRYARKYHQQRPRVLSSQQEQKQQEQQAKGELWGLLRKVAGMIFFATLIGRNR